VPVFVTCLLLLFGFTILVCAGGAVFMLVWAKRDAPRIENGRARRAKATADAESVQDAKSELDALAARISASAAAAREFPELLAEAPPKDPWGEPVEYERSAPDRASLRSAGPDGKFGTKDDIRRELVLK
jgi:hypothetical protein